jgi:hypothetical protein
MLKKSLVAVLGLAVTLAFSPMPSVNAAPLPAGKTQASESLVELAAKKKKAKAKKSKAGKCGTFMYYSKKKCVDARDKK